MTAATAETTSDMPPRARETSARRKWIGRAITLGTLVLMVYLLARTLRQYTLDDLLASVAAVPHGNLALAGLFAALSYALLTTFDWLAVRAIDKRLAYWKTALTCFVSLSIGHSVGLAGLSSGAIRYRFYSRWGLSVGDVAKITLYNGATVTLGLAVLGGGALILRSDLAGDFTGLGATGAVLLGTGCLLLAALYLVLAAILKRPLRIRSFEMEMPPLPIAAAQILVGTVNFALVAACLHQALQAIADVPYLGVASVYVIANVATLVTHVPGGLGVIESVITFLVPGAHVIGAVLVFRLVYFLVPLAIGSLTLGVCELLRRRLKKA